MARLCGGLSELKEATAEVQDLCDLCKPKVEEDAGREFNSFRAVSYRTQLVAGTNYFIKVLAGENEYLHIRVFQPLPHTRKAAALVSHQGGKLLEDEISHF